MTDRSIKVRLTADVNDFKRNLGEASRAASDVGVKAKASAAKSTTAFGQLAQSASSQGEAWTKVGTGLLTTGVAVAAGIGVAVKKFSDFDSAMSRAKAGTQATTSGLTALRDAAVDAGARTQYSATEAADAITAMGKAGVATKDILGGGLNGALALAAAGELDVGRAAEIAATAMTQFNLEGADLPHVADLLAAGAGKAQGSVDDLANALKYVGPVANGVGISIEETTGTIAMFAEKGIVGEQAGTSFRGMLTGLTSPSALAASTMADLGISMYDTSGQFIGMQGVAGQLQEKLGGLTEAQRNMALGQIFGNEQITAARVLYEGGAQAVGEWTAKVDDAGFAAEQAAALTDNLAGDVERLGGSLDTALIKTGSGANEILRSLTQAAEDGVNKFGAMSPAALNATIAIGGTVAAVALASGGFLVLAPRILATTVALDRMAISAPRAVGALRGLTKLAGPAVAAGIAFAALTEIVENMANERLSTGIEGTTKAILAMKDAGTDLDNLFTVGIGIDNVSGLGDAIDRITNPTVLDRMQDLGGFVRGVFGGGDTAGTKVKDQFDAIGESLAGLVEGGDIDLAREKFEQIRVAWEASGRPLSELRDLMPAYVAALDGAANSATLAGPAQKELAEGYDFTTGAVEGQKDALAELLELQAEAAGVVLSERDAQRNLEAAYDGVDAAIEQQIVTLAAHLESQGQSKDAARANAEAQVAMSDKFDITTEAGRTNQAALDDISKSGWDLIESMKANGASQESIQKTMQTTRDRFIAVAEKMGLSKDKAKDLADQLNLIPKNVRSEVQIKTEAADKALAAFLNKHRKITVGTGFAAPGTGVAIREATGGAISGPGSGTSDSIPAWLSDGEHVITAREVEQAGGQSAIYRMRQGIKDGSLRFAQGGGVSLSPIKDTKVPVYADMSGVQRGLESFIGKYPPVSGGSLGNFGGSASKLVAFGRALQAMGFSVAEHPAFGGVRGRHMVGSKHYSGRAIDVNKGAGTSATEQRALDGIVGMARQYGLGTIWRKAGHFNHLHAEYRNGGYTGEHNGIVHPREFVVRASQTAKNLPLLKAINAGQFATAPAAASSQAGPTVVTNMSGNYYSYDPHDITRAANNRMQDAMAAYGIGGR